MRRFLIFCLCLSPGWFLAQDLYDTSRIQVVEIQFSQSNWDYQLDTLKMGSDSYLKADWVRINGKQLNQVGVKYKGNSSYDSTFLKNPLHIELNTYVQQNYQGYVDLKLGNNYADPSLIREVLSYNLLCKYADAPRANFARVFINGTYMGLYSNVESINSSFCRSRFYDDEGVFVKCNPNLTPSPAVKSNLRYIPGDSSAYMNYYEMKSPSGWKSLQALCDTLTNFPDRAGNSVDMDRFLWMLAYNNLYVNLDSYSGAFAQNYYLYRGYQKKFMPIPWDLNMNFGGFPFSGNSNSSLGSLNIAGMQNMSLALHSTDSYWPLIKAVFGKGEWKRTYFAHLKTLLEETVLDTTYLNLYHYFYSQIDSSAQADTRKFYSNNQFQSALYANISVGSYSVPGVKTLMAARGAYLSGTPELSASSPTLGSPVFSAPVAVGQIGVFQVEAANANLVKIRYRYSAATSFSELALYDDGQHGDGAPGDLNFGNSMSISASRMQYYVYAENLNMAILDPAQAEHEFYEWSFWPKPTTGQVVINEFLADNKSDVRNEFHLLADWIELYNNSDTPKDLYGFYLSNKDKSRVLYPFPSSCTLAPRGFLTVWADEVSTGSQQLHAPFKLDKDGGDLILSDGLNGILDKDTYGIQEKDASRGRCPDGVGAFGSLKYPSFGMVNCVLGADEWGGDRALAIYPNPAINNVIVRMLDDSHHELEVYNIQGQSVEKVNFEKEISLRVDDWQPGLYIVRCGRLSAKLLVNH